MAGKTGRVATHPPTQHSDEYTPSWCSLPVRCSRNTSPAWTTQLTGHPGASIPPLHYYSHESQSLRKFTTTSSTLMTPTVPQSSSSINFSHLPPLRLPPPQTASPAGHPIHNVTGPGTSTSTPPLFPYPSNLTPTPSPLYPHCAAKDQLDKWLPHPSTLSLVGPATHPKLQDRVKAVTLQGWADSTHASYSARLLVYHVFCDNREVPC